MTNLSQLVTSSTSAIKRVSGVLASADIIFRKSSVGQLSI